MYLLYVLFINFQKVLFSKCDVVTKINISFTNIFFHLEMNGNYYYAVLLTYNQFIREKLIIVISKNLLAIKNNLDLITSLLLYYDTGSLSKVKIKYLNF